MSRWQPIDFVGGAYSDDALPWTAQDCVNYIPVLAERDGTRSPKLLREAPGFSGLTSNMAALPVRGMHDAEGLLLVVTGTTLYRVGNDGVAVSIGTIPGVERVTIAHNQNKEVAFGNGQSGYVYNITTNTLVQITDDGFPGWRSVDFLDQYILGVEPGGTFWFHSELSNATSFNTLDRYVPEKAPDLIQQAIAIRGDVFVLSERTGQFFANTGAGVGTFQNRSGTEMEVGAASPWTACRLDNTVYWLGNDGIVYRLNGYQEQRISTHALEQFFSRADTSQAYAYTFEDRGHKVYYLTVGGRTFGFDVATGEWHRRESYGLDFWRLTALIRWRKRWIGGDFSNGQLYLLDWGIDAEGAAPIERVRTCPVIHDNQNPVTVEGVELVFDTGVDGTSPPLPQLLIPLGISGNLPDGNQGDSGTMSYAVLSGVAPFSFSVTAGSLPPGALLDSSTGTVTYTYSAPGIYSWTVQVTDSRGSNATVADTANVVQTGLLSLGTGLSGGSPVAAYLSGTSWTSIPRAAVDAALPVRGLTGWLVVGNTNSYRSVSTLATWASVAGVSLSGLSVAMYANGVTIAIGNGGMKRSTDFGTSWSATGTWSWGSPNCLREGNGTQIAGLDGTVNGPYRISTDTGLTWAQGSASAMPYAVNDARYVAEQGKWYLCGGTSVPSDPGLIKTTTNWSAFTTLVSTAPGSVASMARGTGGKWVAVTRTGAIIYTANDWQSFSTSSTTVEGTAGDQQVAFDGTYFYVADNNGASAARTRRSLDGNTWDAPVSLPQNDSIHLLAG